MEESSIEKPMFGQKIALIVYDVDAMPADMILEDAYQEGLRLQHIFNIYDEQSELSLLNIKRSMKVSKELLEVIKFSLKISDETNGTYDVSKGKNFLERKQHKPLSKLGCSYRDILIDGSTINLTHPDILIDLGSIAKGYIADKIADYLKINGILNGMVDARGDIVLFGDYTHKIGVQHPRNDEVLGWIDISNKAIATSGDYKQFNKSYDESHILNQKDAISITTIADSLMVADALATALFVIDDNDRENLLDKHPEIQALIVDKNLRCKTYNGFMMETEKLIEETG